MLLEAFRKRPKILIKRRRKIKKKYFSILILVLLCSLTFSANADAKKAKIKLNKSKITMKVGETKKLKVKGAKAKKVKWKTSNKKVVTVKKGKIKAIATGSAVVTAKYKSKKCKYKVKVQSAGAASNPSKPGAASNPSKPASLAALLNNPSSASTVSGSVDFSFAEVKQINNNKYVSVKVTNNSADTFAMGYAANLYKVNTDNSRQQIKTNVATPDAVLMVNSKTTANVVINIGSNNFAPGNYALEFPVSNFDLLGNKPYLVKKYEIVFKL